MPASPQWTITLEPGANVKQVALALRSAGLVVTDELDVIGVINGAAPAKLVPRLRKVSGVSSVEPLLGFDAGPPV